MATQLTPKQQRFLEEYLIEPNATRAYIRAYSTPDKQVSQKVAEAAGCRLLSNVRVARAIADAQAARAQRLHLTADRVLEELAVVSFSNVHHYTVDDVGRITLAPNAPAAAIRAVSGVERKTRYLPDGSKEVTVKLTLWDKNKSLDMAGKHLGLYERRDPGDTAAVANFEGALDKATAEAWSPDGDEETHGQPV